MEKFYLEEPSLKRKNEAIEFINEFYEYNSDINGTGGLQRFLDNYEDWLQKLEDDYARIPDEDRVPARTYFLIRNTDNKIIGMINIRLALNERLKKFGGNIGYCIRPTERGKGYNKINLYLGLKICQKYGIKEVLLDADKNNPASWKTMEALGGINIKEYFDDENSHCIVKDYKINVNESIEKYSSEYEDIIQYMSLRRHFATNPNNMEIVQEGNLKIEYFEDSIFTGDIALVRFIKMFKPYIVENINLCMANSNYKWLEFYDYNKKYRLTAMYNDKNEIIEWYFDIARKIGKENGIPYEDDLYLDVVVTPNGDVILLDEDELKDAYEKREITREEFENAYKEAEQLMNKLKNNKDKLKEYTDKYLKQMLGVIE